MDAGVVGLVEPVAPHARHADRNANPVRGLHAATSHRVPIDLTASTAGIRSVSAEDRIATSKSSRYAPRIISSAMRTSMPFSRTSNLGEPDRSPPRGMCCRGRMVTVTDAWFRHSIN